jgi:hypothetical protein
MVERINQKTPEMVSVKQTNLPSLGIQSIHIEPFTNHVCHFLCSSSTKDFVEFTVVSVQSPIQFVAKSLDKNYVCT